MSEKIIRCPFCGNEIKPESTDIRRNKYGRFGADYKVRCPKCGTDVLCGIEDFKK